MRTLKTLTTLLLTGILLSVCPISTPAVAQTPPSPLEVVHYYNITNGFTIDNRSSSIRQVNYHNFCATGTGTWSVVMEWSDVSATGPWSSYGSTATVDNTSGSCIGYGNDGRSYHQFLKFTVTGSATADYAGSKNYWISASTGAVSFPIGLGSGGTGATTAAGARLALGITGLDWFNVVDYGADPTGVADSLTAFKAALVAAGGNVWTRADATLTSIVVASSVATATTSTAHLLTTGDKIGVFGATVDADLNRYTYYTVASTPAPTTFTFATAAVADATYNEATLGVSTYTSGGVVYVPPGDYKLSSTIRPSYNVAIKGDVQSLNTSTYSSKIVNTAAAKPLISVMATGAVVENLALVQDSGVTATAGNAGIVIGTSAISAEFRNLEIEGFYYGVDCTGGGGQTNLQNTQVTFSESHGYVSRLCQGYWRVSNATANKGHGFYFTSGVGGSQPWLLQGGTFANGGFGLFDDYVGVTGVDGFFFNNDSLGEVYINGNTSDAGFITNSQVQWAGWNPLTGPLNPVDATSNKLSSQVSAATHPASPIQVTVRAAHGMVAPVAVNCSWAQGNTAMNGTWTATSTGTTTFTLGGTKSDGALVVPASCGVGGVYGTECPKCSLASDVYPSLPTAPAIRLGATAASMNLSGLKIYGANGPGILSTALHAQVIGNSITGSGRGGVTGSLYSINATGGYGTVSSNKADGPVNIGGGHDIIAGNRFSGLLALPSLTITDAPTSDPVTIGDNQLLPGAGLTWSIPAVTLTSIAVSSNVATATIPVAHYMVTGDRVTVSGATVDTDLNGIYPIASTPTPTTFTFATTSVADATYTDAALAIAAAPKSLAIGASARYLLGRHYLGSPVGTVTDAGQPSVSMYPKWLFSYPVTFANLPTGAGAYDGTIQACSDCQVTSAVDNTCKAGGVGAMANRLNGVWRCFWNAGSGSGGVAGAANLTTAGYPMVVDSAGTATQTAILGSAVGGTGNGWTKFTGPLTAEKTFTLPNASSTILTSNAAVTGPQGGTGLTSGTSGGVLYFSGATTLASSAVQAQYKVMVGGGAGAAPATIAGAGTAGQGLVSGGAAANPAFSWVIPHPAEASLSAQATAITTTNLLASADAGTYLVSGYILTTTLSTGACTSNVTIGYTGNSAAKTKVLINAHSHAVDEVSDDGIMTMRVDAASAITYAVTLTGGANCLNAAYSLDLILVRLR
jgi:hypothetical protein